MKVLYKLSSFCLLFLLITSCEEGNDQKSVTKGVIKFNYGETARPGARLNNEGEPFAILISASQNGVAVFDNLKLSLFSFGDGYVSESLQLNTGTYTLTQFLVLDSDNHVIYAAPLEGSEQAQFVTEPLPVDFTVTENGNNLVILEVLKVTDDQTPESYGYVSFGFNIVDPSDSVAVNSVQLKLDGKLWKATYVEQVVYMSSSKLFYLTGRKVSSTGIYESLWIIIPDLTFDQPVPNQNVELQMGFNESTQTGSYWDSNWTWGQQPKIVNFGITEYDTLHNTVSGTFSGYLYSDDNHPAKIITDGVFYKTKLTLQ